MIISKRPGRKALAASAVLTAAALALGLAPAAAQAAPVPAAAPAVVHPMGGNGWVSDGNLRSQPNLGAGIIDTIYNQEVDFTCWIDGGNNGFGSDRWFRADYYGQTGYMSSGVVTGQPSLPSC